MEVAVAARILSHRWIRSSVHAAALTLAVAPLLLASCSGFFTKYEDPQQQGLRLYQEKNYTESAGAFRNAARKDPRDYKSQYYLAVACDADGRYQEAVEAYRAALDVQNITYDGKEDVAFRMKILDGLARTTAKADPHDTLLNQFERQAKSSQKAEDFFLLAKIYRYRSDFDMSLDNYQHGALIDNKYFPLLKEYGLFLQQVGQQQRAVAALSQAYRVNDKDEEVVGALRQMGVVPGPSLKETTQLAQPVVPKGPIPPLDMQKIKNAVGLGKKDAAPNIAPQPESPASSLQAPRD
jgi:tetratricopeptide (TPR) repeat protein